MAAAGHDIRKVGERAVTVSGLIECFGGLERDAINGGARGVLLLLDGMDAAWLISFALW